MNSKEVAQIVLVGRKNDENSQIMESLGALGLPTQIASRHDAGDLILAGSAQAILIRSSSNISAQTLFNENLVGRAKAIPYILLSSSGVNLTKDEVAERGFLAHLKDPVNPNELAKTLQQSLERQRLINQRRHERKEVKQKVKWHASDSTDLFEGIIENISEGGMYIKASEPFPSQQEALAFEIYLDEDSENPIQGFGLVRWKNKENGFGIEFTALTKKSVVMIKRIISAK